MSEKIPITQMEDKYERILKYCEKEVDRVVKMYKKQKDDPPVPRMFPPIAGLPLYNSVGITKMYVFTFF